MSYCSDVIERTARKPHRCEYCGEKILPGERLKVWTAVDDIWYRTYMHKECHEAIGRDKDGWYNWSEYGTNGRRGMSDTETEDAAMKERSEEEAELDDPARVPFCDPIGGDSI